MEHQRKYFVGGNWKSNGSQKFVKEHIENVINKIEYNQDKAGNFIQF